MSSKVQQALVSSQAKTETTKKTKLEEEEEETPVVVQASSENDNAIIACKRLRTSEEALTRCILVQYYHCEGVRHETTFYQIPDSLKLGMSPFDEIIKRFDSLATVNEHGRFDSLNFDVESLPNGTGDDFVYFWDNFDKHADQYFNRLTSPRLNNCQLIVVSVADEV